MKKRMVHGMFYYQCSCGSCHEMFLEKGIEERCNPKLKKLSGLPHKPTPFVIRCPDCKTGVMVHSGVNWLDDFIEARKGMDLFMNVKSLDHGKPVFNWSGE